MYTNNNIVALITGASRGIGHATLQELAQKGFYVVGTATTEVGREKILSFLAEQHLLGTAVILDVTSLNSIEEALGLILKTIASPLVLVNNAGIAKDMLLTRLKDEDWNSVLATNLTGAYRLSKLCLKGMIKASFGRIVNIGSVIGSIGNVGQVSYAASKAGLEGFSKALAREAGRRNITVNTVAPGFIETDMTKSLTETQRQTLLSTIPLKRLGQPQDVAKLIAFLVGEEASYITGQTIHVNGGMYMH